ncbi:S-adenosyl-L-methionine-dependent methyltransferase [Dendryphion nanum]|uniref:S-adenosyl-L-methionine-dependent methyltransferase n=1 Tax=Dendryphion nanum TaxID=256645 RepID=A0A9P9IDP7_9PLEO|nr:S-adenosyl-L-methionine-dependent methyltransferase [Dendryphion nanum]
MSENKSPDTVLDLFNSIAAGYEVGTGGCTYDTARHIFSLCPITKDSIILDNACGPGIVAHYLLSAAAFSSQPAPTLHCTDFSPAMIQVARDTFAQLPNAASVSFDVMSGEDLSFPDNTFTHSITNFGIMFFPDAVQGAKEIYRTLRPGGTAVVTSWAKMGYVEPIHRAQKATKPHCELFVPPMPPQWYSAEHVIDVLKKGGFEHVEIHEKVVCFGGESAREVSEMVLKLFGGIITKTWSDEEKRRFEEELHKAVEHCQISFERPTFGREGAASTVFGVPMTALVAVARK